MPVQNTDSVPLNQQSLNKGASNVLSDPTVIVGSRNPVSQASKSITPKVWTYRVRGIPAGLDWQATKSLIETTLDLGASELRSLAPDPYKTQEQVATLEISQPPYGKLNPQLDSEWQIPIPSICTPDARELSKSTITVDKHFHGLTPLNTFTNLEEDCIEFVF